MYNTVSLSGSNIIVTDFWNLFLTCSLPSFLPPFLKPGWSRTCYVGN